MKKLTVLSIAIAASLMTQGVFAHGHGGYMGGTNSQLSCEQLISSARHQAKVAETLAYFDLNKDDQITQDEVQASHQARFTQLDTDGNGYLSLSEFQAGAPGATTTTTTTTTTATTTTDTQTRGGRGHRGGHLIANDAVMTKFQNARFARLDTNSDGQISLAEFTVNLPAFDKFDTDGNGVVTKDDLLKGACSSTTTTTTTDAATTTTTDTTTVTTPTVTVEEPVVIVEEPVVTDTITTTQPTVTQPTTTTTTTNDHSGGLPCSNCH